LVYEIAQRPTGQRGRADQADRLLGQVSNKIGTACIARGHQICQHQIEAHGLEPAQQFGLAARAQHHLDPRPANQRTQETDLEVPRERCQRTDTQHAAHGSDMAQGRRQILGRSKDRLCVVQRDSARLGQDQSASAPFEQILAERGLERADLRRQRRLRQVQRMCRAGKRLRLDAISATMTLLVAFIGWIVMRYARSYLDGEAREGAVPRADAGHCGGGSGPGAGGQPDRFWFWPSSASGPRAAAAFAVLSRPGRGARAADQVRVGLACGRCRADPGGAPRASSARRLRRSQARLRPRRTRLSSGRAPGGRLLVLAAALKTAAFPLHGWLTEVMEAPTPVSALLHAGIINAGGFPADPPGRAGAGEPGRDGRAGDARRADGACSARW
jgi:hypothetical protein